MPLTPNRDSLLSPIIGYTDDMDNSADKNAASLEAMQEQIDMAAAVALPDREIVFRPMFGGVCAYVEGRVFASLSNVGLGLKLPPAAQADLLLLPDACRLRYEPDAPESKQYIVVPPAMQSDADALAPWVARSIEFVLSLPAPKTKAKKVKEK